MSINIKAEYHDGIASTAFYPKMNPVKIATGGAGDLAGGGWSVDTWATVVQIWVAKSNGTWESQAVAPLGGNIPQSPSIHISTTDAYGTWTNPTSLYSIYVVFETKVSGVWTFDWDELLAAGSTSSSTRAYDPGTNVRFRCRYTSGGTDGDWTAYRQGIIPI